MRQRLILVQRLQLGAQERNQIQRASRRAEEHADERLRPLRVRDDDLRLRRSIERLRVDVADDAHDLPGVLVLAEVPQAAADGIAIRQESADERLVHEDHGRRALVVRRT